ncbi:MAG: hypothetical protein KGR26_03300, partial [Cyanobacteria bacterium REEB65]|nr:hypothetical protein [Cyanobacteria bacterium REEB65]
MQGASSGLIGNAGSGLIGNAGSGLIGNAGSGLIGNAGSGLIGNAGSGLIGNAGSGYRITGLQSPSFGLLSQSPSPQAGAEVWVILVDPTAPTLESRLIEQVKEASDGTYSLQLPQTADRRGYILQAYAILNGAFTGFLASPFSAPGKGQAITG